MKARDQTSIFQRSSNLFLMVSSAVLAAGSNLMLRHGMSDHGSVNSNEQLIIGAISSPLVILGLVGYAFSYALWLFILSRIKLGVAYPIYVSSLVVMVLAGSILVLGEELTLPRIGSGLFVMAGVVIAEWRGDS